MSNKHSLLEYQIKLRELMPSLIREYQIQSIFIFGSYVRDEEQPSSDLDLLIDFREPPSLLEFVRLENYLGDQLGIKVDLVMKDALRKRIGRQILKEAISI